MASNFGFSGWVAKTAAYTVVPSDNGTDFTNTGATGTVIFTLPAVATSAGMRLRFHAVADYTVTVTAPSGTAVTYNNAAATSLSLQTGSGIIGGRIDADCDGTYWHLVGVGPHTHTVA